MSNSCEFLIENGVLVKYNGTDAHVVIPEGVTSIRTYAFYKNSQLRSVVIPESVTAIGPYAFAHCDLQSLTIPKSVTTIGPSAFAGCRAIESLTIPASVSYIGAHGFYGCKGLTLLTLENGAMSKGDRFDIVFHHCSKLQVIVAPGIDPQHINIHQRHAAAVGYLISKEQYHDPHWIDTYETLLDTQLTKILATVLSLDLAKALSELETMGKITADHFEETFLLPAINVRSFQCIAFLMDWKNRNTPPEDWEEHPL